jgi:hypothetical protein
MKKFILALSLACSGAAFAENMTPVFPEVYSLGRSVQFTVRNFTNQSITCSGPIYLVTTAGFPETVFVNEFVPARFTTYKNFYPRSINDRVLRISHSIFCR